MSDTKILFFESHGISFSALAMRTDPFYLKMPEELRECYLNDFINEMPFYKNKDGSLTWNYITLEVFAKMP
jgi:hypothetical protein